MKMLRFGVILMVIFFLLANFSYSSAIGDMRISFISGDVQIREKDSSDFVPAAINMPVKEGANLYVPKGGKAEVQLGDGTRIRLNENSSIQILKGEKNSYHFHFKNGDLYANFTKSSDSVIQVDSPGSTVVRLYDRAIFSKNVSGEGDVDVSVFEGTVDVENETGKTMIKKGQSISYGEKPPAEICEIGAPDGWEKWNAEMDKKNVPRDKEDRTDSKARDIQTRDIKGSQSYLPEDLRSYSRDFDDNGKWTYVKEYGQVWSPTVSSPQWAPYKDGRWTWIGEDYVWVSYEPWGWAPYHYGRWVYIQGTGWGWVPPKKGEVYWGPGFVGWVSTPTHVAWVPLAPGEIYYGYGVYGPHSVDIRTNQNINVTKVVYKNVRVSNAVTVITPKTFVTGQAEEVKVRGDVFRQVRVGRPDIKPEKATMMPVVRDIPQDKRPPQQVMDLKVEQLEKSRPFVRDRSVSVSRPGLPSREMEVKAREGKREERRVEREKMRYEGKAAERTSPTEKQGDRRLRRRERESREGKAEGPGLHEKQSDAPNLRSREGEGTGQAEKERRRKDRSEIEGKGGPREDLEQEGHKPEKQKGKLFDPSEIFKPRKNRPGQQRDEGIKSDQTDKKKTRKSKQQDEEKTGRKEKKKQGSKRSEKGDD